MEEKPKTGQAELFEDVEVLINLPYNMPLKRIFECDLFTVKIMKENGGKPIIIIRFPKNDENKLGADEKAKDKDIKSVKEA